MTEEIIIDGVNVAGCLYHRMNNKMAMCTTCNSGKGSPFCEYEKDCYYKQLQRLKQENEKLKKENAELLTVSCLLEDNKYRKALEEIREIAEDIVENDVYENSDAKAEKILDKINEVIG